ncbi:hypothetical protein MN032_12155 [Agromyces atrinae]|uniref:hypothetical protein n=1 Tax=Agromyces atrinae TaxID=592376 RepID=UPI001F560A23|nr:hypothetical protein [Agromyces atrinae]MCI2958447.1 hypothetical protein [Agromyces atrinae]
MTAVVAEHVRATPGRALRAEWLKFGTLISNPLTVIVTFLLIAGLAVLLVWARATESMTPTVTELLTGASWAQMLIAVLAVVFACSEWSSGLSQVTFLAVPTRWPVLLGKAVVMGVTAFFAGSLGAGAALIAGAIGGVDVAGDADLAVRLVLGAGAYLAGIAILVVGIGVMVRNLIAGILTVIGVIWVLPLAITLIPWEPLQRVVPYLPSPAGGLLIAAENPVSELTPWAGGAVLFAWAIAVSIAAAFAVRSRDV